jgi:hypothetical protein
MSAGDRQLPRQTSARRCRCDQHAPGVVEIVTLTVQLTPVARYLVPRRHGTGAGQDRACLRTGLPRARRVSTCVLGAAPSKGL